MGLEEVKSAVKNLTAAERRKVALYILELEKEHLQSTIGPQLAEDLEGVSRVLQDAIQRLKKFGNKDYHG